MEKDPELSTTHEERVENLQDVYVAAGESHRKDKKERRLILKQDLSIVLLLSGCYWFAYLDRGAIGNARIMGFQKDLHLSESQFYNCLMMFFVGYMVFELPAALSLRWFPPNYIYGTAVVLFGVFACSLSASRSYAAVMVLRLFIGLGEAYVQTGFVFLSLWYKRDELTTRCAFYYVSAPIAGAMSGLIAYGVQHNLNGDLGRTAWEWFFLIEGILTIAWGLLVFAVLPKLPETVAAKGHFLFKEKEERDLILQRSTAARNTADVKVSSHQIWLSLKDPKTWLFALIVASPCLNVAAFGAFLPTFIKEFGFTPLNTQLYSIIPYAFATLTLPLCSIMADRINKRALPVLVCLFTSVIGFVIILATTNKTVLIVGCCFIAAGSYPALVIAASWLMNNIAGYTKRCTSWAVAQVFIQCYSIISTQIYDNPPRFFKGHGILLGLNALGVIAAGINYWLMKRENWKRDKIAEGYILSGEKNTDDEKSYEELCDYHPQFRYQL